MKLTPALRAALAYRDACLTLETLPDDVSDADYAAADETMLRAEHRLIVEIRGPRPLSPGETTW